jgi:hypothetical protein
MDAPLPVGFEKPPPLGTFDGTSDPNEHIENIDAMLTYCNVSGAIRCRLFPTTLRKTALAWYKSLPSESITSSKGLCKQFSRHFTASRSHPKTEVVLEAIIQRKDEPLRSYIERFMKEAVQVAIPDSMKKYLLERGILLRTDFAKSVGIDVPPTFDALLQRAQKYVQYEEREAAITAKKPRTEDTSSNHDSSRRGDKKKDDRPREPRIPPSRFKEYTPLIASREHILSECAAAEFRRANIKFPKQVPTRPGQDKSKYCVYHKSHGHVTEECIHLRDAIEILIRDGVLDRFVKRDNAPRQERRDTRTGEEVRPSSSDQAPPQIALCISRPEDFLIPEDSFPVPAATSKWEHFPSAMVISGGGFNKLTIGSVKRKFEELIDASSNQNATLDKQKGSCTPIAFYREELPGGSPNHQIPLLVRAYMANFDVRRILVDQGSSVDIMYTQLFKTLHLDERHLTPYVGLCGAMWTCSSHSAATRLPRPSRSRFWSSTVPPSTSASLGDQP